MGNIYDLTRTQLLILRLRYRSAAVLWVMTLPVWGTLSFLAMAVMWPCRMLQQPYDQGIGFDAKELWSRIPTDDQWKEVNS